MKEWDLIPTISAASSGTGKPAMEAGLFYRSRYKLWALALILLLAFWSMLAGTVTLKWSAGNLNGISGDLLSHEDLDEVEEREKVVRHMWDVYTHSQRIRLPRFWRDAFEAAYEDLASDEGEIRDAAVTEIARMSMRMIDLEPPPPKSKKSKVELSQTDRDGTANSKSSLSSSADTR
ncbi:uncharacterized protein LOC110035713 isoform X2 [Phalaenopsis equestris]|uniref:uncharacterized protein LOC110035713 isoform X2 n=1 Tax=Phalaenopsis equestris TaxID=78828 RepID=UPI0009E4AF2E|nr:uncharacterized protein LOC110035713 isoform X2 [Phalaenopsis equestris]